MYNPETNSGLETNSGPEINSVLNSGTNFGPETNSGLETDSPKGMTRRDFLRQMGLIGGSALVARYTPSYLLDVAPPEVCGMPLSQLDAATPEVCGFSLAQRLELMSNPEFFTELQGENTKKIFTNQLDHSEYIKVDGKVPFKNCCGQATLATSLKMLEFFNTCKVPDITIADVILKLKGETFKDKNGYEAPYIVDWNKTMYWVGIPGALETLAPHLISKTEFLTPNYGARYTKILPQSKWPETLSKAQAVCEDGGFVIIGCLKYRSGHFLLGTDVKEDGTAIIIDSFSSRARRVLLRDYFEHYVDSWDPSLGRQPVLLHMFGITPKLNIPPKPGLKR